MKQPPLRYVGDKRIREALRKYDCPTPFHAVRTRFLGNIATPRLDASPIEAVKDLWGGELPPFEDMDAANALLQDLMGLWNHLTRHQSRSKPFRLVHVSAKPTRDDLLGLCRTRSEELEGFVDGLFGGDEEVDLPERAAAGMDRLGEINAMILGVLHLLDDQSQSPTETELGDTLRNVNELSRIAEQELHDVILACVRARRQSLAQGSTRRPTFH